MSGKLYFLEVFFTKRPPPGFNEERLSELLTVSKNLEIKELATVININNKSSVNKKTNEHKNIILDKIEDISENLKLTSSEDIALTEPQAQAAPLVAKKSANSNLSGHYFRNTIF